VPGLKSLAAHSIVIALILGHDADTVGAVVDQIAGAVWGFSGIPSKWVERLFETQRIQELGRTLFEHGVQRLPYYLGCSLGAWGLILPHLSFGSAIRVGYALIQPDKDEIAIKSRKITSMTVLGSFWDYYKRQLGRYERGHGPLVVL